MKKYVWTPEKDAILHDRYDGRIRNRSREIAQSFGWPTWTIRKRAAALGLCYPADRRDWTEEDVNFLLDHAGSRMSYWIARKLKRSETSVVMKFKRMKISRRVHDGYTLRELELCFGTDHHVIEKWVREGKLCIRKRHIGGARHIWKATDENILRFICEYPMAFRLDKVDQVWFLDLITAGGLMRKALKAVRDTEESKKEVA